MKLNRSTTWTLVAGLGLGLLAGFSACAPANNGGNGGGNDSNENSNTGGGDPNVIFPEDYLETYLEVRNCRPTTEHAEGNILSIRVVASPNAEQAYLNDETIPEGGVIVKEEFSDFDCQVLSQYRPMRKEAAGFDVNTADWRYQKVSATREVIEDGPDSCIGCHSQPECVARDYMCTCPDPDVDCS